MSVGTAYDDVYYFQVNTLKAEREVTEAELKDTKFDMSKFLVYISVGNDHLSSTVLNSKCICALCYYVSLNGTSCRV